MKMKFHKSTYMYWLYIVSVILLTLWGIRVVYLNNDNESKNCYLPYDSVVNVNGLGISVDDWMIIDRDMFLRLYNIPSNMIEESTEKIITAKLRVKNNGAAIKKEEIMNSLGNGFETKTWGSSNSPFVINYINNAMTDLEKGESEVFVVCTTLRREAFKQNRWDQIDKELFFYTFLDGECTIKIRLGSMNEKDD